MRAIGASTGSVMQVFIVEGVLIGLMSWFLGMLLALPVGKLLSVSVGMETMNTPLTYIRSLQGILIWLGLAVVISAVASYIPARQAAGLSVRQVLAYEQ